MISRSFPGKLYLLGEYFVMEPGAGACILAVNRYLTTTITKSDTLKIMTAYGDVESLNQRDECGPLRYVINALHVAYDYIHYKGKKLVPFQLNIESELEREDHAKYGFGSSGVVIVAVIASILEFHGLAVSSEVIFKLAVLAQYRMQELSSGGDLAVAAMKRSIYYQRYNPKVLSKDVQCVDKMWEGLVMEPLHLPYFVEVGWTQKSWKTQTSLEAVSLRKKQDKNDYNMLMIEAKKIVDHFRIHQTLDDISQYRKWLLKFAKWADIFIETPELTALIEGAQKAGYVAKSSGAGGGDCGIALSLVENKQELTEIWKKNNIEIIEEAVKKHDTIQ